MNQRNDQLALYLVFQLGYTICTEAFTNRLSLCYLPYCLSPTPLRTTFNSASANRLGSDLTSPFCSVYLSDDQNFMQKCSHVINSLRRVDLVAAVLVFIPEYIKS